MNDQPADERAERPAGPVPGAPITVYWRPGCGFCAALRMRLRASGVRFDEVNIWIDPDAAAFVRSVAGGNETVPTVSIGPRSLVNPSARQVLAVAREVDPDLLEAAGRTRPSPIAALRRLFGGRPSGETPTP